MNPVIDHVVHTPNGVCRAVCSPACGRTFLFANRHLTGARLRTLGKRPNSSCAHCVACGELVAAPDACRFHESGCPDFYPMGTWTVAATVYQLMAEFDLTDLTPRAWQYLDRAAEHARIAGDFTFESMVMRMRDVSVDWLPFRR